MSNTRQSLYQRLPEIYRIKDSEQIPPGQLEAWLDILDQTQSALQDNIDALYHDLFIDSCHDWVIPYIADLLGTSHLSGEPWTLRADVARTIKHRRRKGTLGSIESLTYALSRWAVHTVELRDRVVWSQHLHHQRPDRFGEPPLPLLIEEKQSISGAVQGGTINLRDPALLSFYDGPFDPFAKIIDVKPITIGATRYNIPNLAIFIWRLQEYTLPVIKPLMVINERFEAMPAVPLAGEAEFVTGFEVHPLGEPMVLFNTHRYNADAEPPDLTHRDAVPGPMPMARLSNATQTGMPESYVELAFYAAVGDLPSELTDDRVGLTLYLPDTLNAVDVDGDSLWAFRGANLCAWQAGLNPPLGEYEIAIDPDHGRILFGVTDQVNEANVIEAGLFASPSYGFSGPTGAQPGARKSLAENKIIVNYDSFIDEAGITHPAANGTGLQLALDDIQNRTAALIIEIVDSRNYELNLNAVSGIGTELGLSVLRLSESLHIRAASGQRPIIILERPLAFRPDDVADPGVEDLNVKLEGLYITWNQSSAEFGADTALIERAALNQLLIEGCTLDPGSHKALDGTRQSRRYALNLDRESGFDPVGGEDFDQIPKVIFARSICGPISMDDNYELTLTDSIVDVATGLGANTPELAVHASTGLLEDQWGPALTVNGMTCFGRMRVASATGAGGIWVHGLEVHNDLIGCIKLSYFAATGNKLPQHQACVFGNEVALSFTSEVFGEAGYAQIRLRSDSKLLEQGPGHDAMGAFGSLLNTHKWKNINIRYREFMPVGVRPVLVPVT
jgi:hypothetical protein